MQTHQPIAIIGASILDESAMQNRALEESLFDLTNQVLADASLDIDDIDGIVVGANDQYDGRAIAIMAASGSVGGVDRDILSTPSAGEHALVMGAMRVGSGTQQTQLVVAWSPTEVDSLSETQRLAADPYYHRRLPLDELSSHALQATALEHAIPHARAAAAELKSVVRGNAPGAGAGYERPRWPFGEHDVALPSAGAVALVIASGDFAARRNARNVVNIEGMGWATEPAYLGDRNLADLPSLRAAAQRAYRAAAIENARAVIGAAEVADATPHQALLALEGLGLSDRGQWRDDLAAHRFSAGGGMPLNQSGGASVANPVFCAGLQSVATAALQCRRTHAPVLAHASSGFAMQYNTVVVMRNGESK